MNCQSKTTLTPATQRERSLVLCQARRLLTVALVLIAFASLYFIARRAGAAGSDRSSRRVVNRANINPHAAGAGRPAGRAEGGATACVAPPANMAAWFAGDGSTIDLQGGDSATLNGNAGSVTFTTGKVAQAFQFNGAGRLEVADAPALDVSSAVTIDAWINPLPGGYSGLIAGKGNFGSGNDQPYSIFLDGSSRQLTVRVGNSSTFDALGSIAQIPFNTYTHVAATYDGTTMRLYINGNLDNSKMTNIGPLVNSSSPFVIGGISYQGIIDEVEVFSQALAQSEIQSIVAADSAGKCKNITPTPTPTSCVATSEEMTAWYPFDGNTIDLRGGNDGTPWGSYSPGKIGQAIQFNGNGPVYVSDTRPGLDFTTALTIEGWVSPASQPGHFGMIVGKGNFGSTGDQPYSLFFNGDSRQITFRVGNNTRFDALTSFNSLPENAYTHVAATYDGTRMRLYLNGNLDAVKTTDIGPLVQDDLNLLIGASAYVGSIDELKLFSRALSEAEIKMLFAADSFGTCKPAPGCRIIRLSPASLPNGAVDTLYRPQTIRADSAGDTSGQYTYSVTSGELPPGMTLSSSFIYGGQLSGTPTTAGTYTFTVTATNSNGCSGSRAYTMTIDLVPTCTAPPSGMVMWLSGDGNANDISGNGNHGTLQNGTSFAPGKVAQSFVLDGVDDYILVNHSPSLMPTAVTVDVWIYPTSYGTPYTRIIEKGGATATDNGGYSIEFNPCEDGQPTCPDGHHGVVFLIWTDNGIFQSLNSDPIPLNTWTHIAGTFDGDVMRLYIDSTLRGTRAASMGSTTDNLAIGRRPNFAEKYFPGRIDELEVFNRALSEAEIQSIVSAGSAGKCKPTTTRRLIDYDFDGDGKTDVAYWNPTSHNWLILDSITQTKRFLFDWGSGALGDIAVPRDYDGDGKADVAIFRPSEGNWYIIQSINSANRIINWGQSGDRPVPADYDGDGKADAAVFRPSEGNWYILNSATSTVTVRGWGAGTDIPVPGFYDSDAKADIAVYRSSEGNWYIIESLSNSARLVNWGTGDDRPTPADYDGDGRTDLAVFRPSEGNWYLLHSTGGVTVKNWGNQTDKLVPGDYDGDGRADIAVYRPSDGNWYIIQSQTNTVRAVNFSQGTDDVPAPSTYIQQ